MWARLLLVIDKETAGSAVWGSSDSSVLSQMALHLIDGEV